MKKTCSTRHFLLGGGERRCDNRSFLSLHVCVGGGESGLHILDCVASLAIPSRGSLLPNDSDELCAVKSGMRIGFQDA